MSDEVLEAQITEPGHPLQGAAVKIRWGLVGPEVSVAVDVHLDAAGGQPARWVPVQLVDLYLPPAEDHAWEAS